MSDQFIHLRILIGIVLGLSITSLLTGLAGLIQHQDHTFEAEVVTVTF